MENSAPDYIDSILELNNPLSKVLDNLLNDYSKDVSDIYLTLYNLKEATTKWNEVSLTSLITLLDEQALKISELKEEYVNRRKTLASNIRIFTSKYIENDSSDIMHYNNMKLEAKQIIELFKSNFDYLATSAKFSESSFLSTYKLLREIQDPCIIFDECSNVITKSQNSLKYAQEQIVQGVAYLESVNEENNDNDESKYSQKEFIELKEKNIELQSYIDDLEQKLQSEKHRNDIEIRNKEQKIRNDIEEQLIEQQKTFELSLSRKEMEINSLLSTINDYNQQSIEANEKGKTLETELIRRRDLEERVRITMTELANANQTISEVMKRNESLQFNLTTLESELEKNKISNKKIIENMEESKLKALAKCQEMEKELLIRPPLDLSNLAEKIGIELHDDSNNNYIEWKTIENYLVEKVRKVCSEAAESRVREQEILKNFKFKEEECDILKVKSSNDSDTIKNMERDLIEAHKTIESQKTLLKFSSNEQYKEESSNPNSPKNKIIRQPSKGKIFSPGKLKGSVDNNDIEVGTLQTATALNGATSNDPSDRILIAVQNQRDRYMKASMEKETELNNCKANLERVEEEQHRLRDENLELYRRLRILRATSRKGHDNDDENVRVRISRRDGRSNSIDENVSSSSNNNSDVLEKKYMKAYEEHIDPWRVEELDRQQILSRLNIFEKSLAYVVRFILQDSWARHALMVYLVIVHIFALGYIWQVLNPQLIEEIDQNMKERLAAATYDVAFTHSDVE